MWTALKKTIACALLAALILPAGATNAVPEKPSASEKTSPGEIVKTIVLIPPYLVLYVVVEVVLVAGIVVGIPVVFIDSALHEKTRNEKLKELAASQDSEKKQPGSGRRQAPPTNEKPGP